MIVREMIEMLRAYPDDLRVVVNGYEDGYDDLSPWQPVVVAVVLDAGVKDWDGRHGEPRDVTTDAAEPAKIVDALVLRRTSN